MALTQFEILFSGIITISFVLATFLGCYILADYPDKQTIYTWMFISNSDTNVQKFVDTLVGLLRKNKVDSVSNYYEVINTCYQRLGSKHDYNYHMEQIEKLTVYGALLVIVFLPVTIITKFLPFIVMILAGFILALAAKPIVDSMLKSQIKVLNTKIGYELANFCIAFSCIEDGQSIRSVIESYTETAGAFKGDLMMFLSETLINENTVMTSLLQISRRVQQVYPVKHLAEVISYIESFYQFGGGGDAGRINLINLSNTICDESNDYLGKICDKGIQSMVVSVTGALILWALLASLPILIDVVNIREVLAM